ncbi:hypothetical protein D3C85_1382500 [compost metagenome]
MLRILGDRVEHFAVVSLQLVIENLACRPAVCIRADQIAAVCTAIVHSNRVICVVSECFIAGCSQVARRRTGGVISECISLYTVLEHLDARSIAAVTDGVFEDIFIFR